MSLAVVYRRQVGRDLAAGFGYYEGQRKGWASAFSLLSVLRLMPSSAIRKCSRRSTAKCAERSYPSFPMASSTVSNPNAWSFWRYCTRRAIRDSGRSLEGLRANTALLTDTNLPPI
jgi:hypothetical protein